MQHATLADVFNMGARAASPFIQQRTDELRQQNELQLKNEAANFAVKLNNKIRDTQFNAKNHEDSETAYNEYLNELNTFAAQEFERMGRANNSKYYTDSLRQLQTESMGMIRGHALERQDQWRYGQEAVKCNEEIQGFMGIDAWTPEKKMQAINDRITWSAAQRPLTPQQIEEMRQNARTSLYGDYMEKAMSGAGNVNNLKTILENTSAYFNSIMPETETDVLDAEGKPTGEKVKTAWTFQNRKEWEEGMIGRHTRRIQEEHGSRILEAEGTFQRLIQAGNYEGAKTFGKQEAAKLNRYYKQGNSEYGNLSGTQLKQFDGYFNWRNLEGYLKQPNGKEALPLDLDPDMRRLIRAALPGGGGKADINGELIQVDNLTDAWEKFIDYKKIAFFDANEEGVVSNMKWANAREEWWEAFQKKTKTMMGAEDRNLLEAFEKLTDYDTYKKKNFNEEANPYYIKLDIFKGDEYERDMFIQKCVNFTKDLVLSSGVTDPVEINRRVQNFIARDILTTLEWKKTPETELQIFMKMQGYTDEVLSGKADDEVFSPTRTESMGLISDKPSDSSLIWRHDEVKKYAHIVRQMEQDYLIQALGITDFQTLNKIQPGWMTSKDGDPIPKGQFKIEGEKAGTYQIRYDESHNIRVWQLNGRNWEPTDILIEPQLSSMQQASRDLHESGSYWRQPVLSGWRY